MVILLNHSNVESQNVSLADIHNRIVNYKRIFIEDNAIYLFISVHILYTLPSCVICHDSGTYGLITIQPTDRRLGSNQRVHLVCSHLLGIKHSELRGQPESGSWLRCGVLPSLVGPNLQSKRTFIMADTYSVFIIFFFFHPLLFSQFPFTSLFSSVLSFFPPAAVSFFKFFPI